MRRANTQECIFFGRKLSNIVSDIEIHVGWDICIGSDIDDEIYFPPVLKDGDEMKKDRVKVMIEDDGGKFCEFDLEDLLVFAAKNCGTMYKRVIDENNEDT